MCVCVCVCTLEVDQNHYPKSKVDEMRIGEWKGEERRGKRTVKERELLSCLIILGGMCVCVCVGACVDFQPALHLQGRKCVCLL